MADEIDAMALYRAWQQLDNGACAQIRRVSEPMNYAISLRFIGWCNLLVGKTHVTSRLFYAWCFA